MPSGSNVDSGDYVQLNGLSANTLNGLLVPITNVSSYKWLTLDIGADAYVGVLSFEASFDASTWRQINVFNMNTLDIGNSGQSTSGQSVSFGCPIWFPYFQCRMSTYFSGVATGTLYLKREGLPFTMMIPQTRLFLGHQYFGLINNDGTSSVEIAAGKVADTVLTANGGTMLARVLVTTAGTNQMLVYDHASAGTGKVIGVVPANSPVNGVPLIFKMPASNGITVKGDSNNPGVTISFADLV